VDKLRSLLEALGKEKRVRCTPSAVEQTAEIGLLELAYAAAYGSEDTERVMIGSASLYARISRDVFLIFTAAHNLASFEERMGERLKKEAKRADFFLQNDAGRYLLKFNLLA